MSVLRKERLSRLITSIILGLLLTGVVLYALADQTRLVFANSCKVPASYPTIQSAIDDPTCDTINVAGGVYTETLLISRNVAISGAGPEQTIVNGNHAGRPVTVNGMYAGNGIVVSLSGMRLTNGDASTGTSILTQFGGGIVITGGARLNGDNLQIDHNLASSTSNGYGGGVAVNGATAYLTDCKIILNTANQRQGSAYGSGYGGGVYVKSSDFHLTNSQVMGNLASQNAGDTLVASGGGMHVGAESQLYLIGNTWQGNIARGKDGQACGFSSCSGGTKNEGGGAIGVSFDTGTAAITITNDTFLDNIANDVEVFDASTANSDHGGALSFNTTGDTGRITATLIGVTMKGNIAAKKVVAVLPNDVGRGGAVYARHTSLVVKGAVIVNNQAAGSGEGSGGGIFYEAPFEGDVFELDNSILAGNIACRTSDCGDGAQVYIDHSTRYDNRANIVFTTIADAGLNPRQGIYYSSPVGDSLYITNTIITSHTVGIENPYGNVAVSYSLFHGNTDVHIGEDFIATQGNLPNQPDPLFVNPARDDYHLQAGSPAIDAGVDAGIAMDIDGEVRPQGSGFDIGADEMVIIPPTDTPTPTFTPTPSPTASSTPSPTASPTASCTSTPTPTGTLTPPSNHKIFLPVLLR
jgi:fibronectin-binding autotransporter adhesin